MVVVVEVWWRCRRSDRGRSQPLCVGLVCQRWEVKEEEVQNTNGHKQAA